MSAQSQTGLNWKRGFHRLFFVLSAIWILVAVLIKTHQLLGPLASRERDLDLTFKEAAATVPQTAPPHLPAGYTLDAPKYLDPATGESIADEVPESTLSPERITIVDFIAYGQKVPALPAVPAGYHLDDPGATRKVKLAGVGLIDFPASLDNATITGLLKRAFSIPKKYNIFDIIQVEAEAKDLAYSTKQQELATVRADMPFHRRFLHAFGREHWRETLSFAVLPPTAIYAFLALTYATLRWIARGFRAKTPTSPEQKSPPSLEG